MTEHISRADREAMVDRSLSLLGGFGDRDLLAQELDEQIQRITDRDFAAKFHGIIGLAAPDDYLARLIEVDGERLLCGIRFYGGDPSKPFVDVLGMTGDGIDLSRAWEAATGAFSVFSPPRVRVFGASRPVAREELTPTEDQVLAVARCADMAAHGGPERVQLVDADPDEAAEFVRAQYEALRARDPELGSRVFASERDELARCANDGRLAWWMIDGERAGVIAAVRTREFGIDGYLMIEEVVAPAYAGRGSAAVAQRALAAEFERLEPGSVLMGTIDASNTASRRTAQRAGRREIASWWFIARGSDAVPVW